MSKCVRVGSSVFVREGGEGEEGNGERGSNEVRREQERGD